MATSRRGPAGETGQETDQPADQQPEPTSDVQRAQQAGDPRQGPSPDATRTTDQEWPNTRENGNPFEYGRVKRTEDTQPAEGDEA